MKSHVKIRTSDTEIECLMIELHRVQVLWIHGFLRLKTIL